MKFTVVLHKDSNSAYGVIVPDVPGCFSAGATVMEALDHVKEALSLHLQGLAEDGDPLPQLRDIEDHLANPDFTSGIWKVVELDPPERFTRSPKSYRS